MSRAAVPLVVGRTIAALSRSVPLLASDSDSTVPDHCREHGRLDRWVLPAGERSLPVLHHPTPER